MTRSQVTVLEQLLDVVETRLVVDGGQSVRQKRKQHAESTGDQAGLETGGQAA
jgi:hypothetical protein